MAYVRVRRPMPIAGLRTAWPTTEIEETQSPRAMNVRFRFGEVTQGPGRRLLSGPTPTGRVRNIARFSSVNGNRWAMMLTDDELYRWGAGTPGNPLQWHRVPGPVITGSGRFSTIAAEDRFFFSRLDEPIYEWNGDTGVAYKQIVASGGTVPKARFVEYFADRLIAISTIETGTEFTNRLRFTVSGDYTDWAGLGSGILDLFEGEEESIEGARVLGGRLVIYRAHSITDVTRTGQATQPLAAELRVLGFGTQAPWTIASNGIQHFFLGTDGNVYVWNGVQISSIGDQILDELQAFYDPSDLDNFFGAISHQTQEYWLVTPTGNIFIYDYMRGTWARDSIGDITALAEVEDTLSAETWATIATTWETESRLWSEMSGTTISRLFAGRSDGSTFIIDDQVAYDYFSIGSLITHYVETPDFYFWDPVRGETPDPMEIGTLRRILVLYEYVNSQPFEVGVSFNRGLSWFTYTVTPDPRGFTFVDVNETGPLVRFRFLETDANARFRYESYVYEFEPAGPLNPGPG